MKIIIVSLALLFFTGSQARYLWQNDAPPPSNPAEVILAGIYDYIEADKQNSKKLLEHIERSEIGQQYGLKFSETFDELDAKAQEVKKALAEFLADWRMRLRKVGEPVLQQARVDLESAYDKFIPIMEELRVKISSHFDTNKEKLIALAEEMRASTQKTSTDFREKLTPLGQELVQKIRALAESLKPLGQKIHERYGPIRERVHERVSQGLDTAKERLSSTAEGAVAKLGPFLHSFRVRIADVLESISQSISEKSAS